MLRLNKTIYLIECIRTNTFKRFSHHQNQVRVRFAPSPTGYLHLGGLRTALYNYLYTRSQNGVFILRIEDTDQTRLVPGAQEQLIKDILWTGIEIDEGPSFGGKYGPYVQSERKDLYMDAVQRLLDNGTAYRCFCTDRRLNLLRREALRTRQIPRYDNKCRHLSAKEIHDLLEYRSKYCIRFKLSEDEQEPLQDLIYGKVQHNVTHSEGDPVIMKTDNFPTYHFANVVDDHMMQVTHVLRGVEWQISTSKHLQLYKAFGWEPPQYGHLPLLVNADGTKLSKRQGDIGVMYFREKGYFPNALNNYVVSAGGGFEHKNLEKPQLFTLSELAGQFDIAKVNSHPSHLNPDILDDFNRLEIKKILDNPKATKDLIPKVQGLVRDNFPLEAHLDLNPAHIENVLKWSVNRVTVINDLVSPGLSFLWVQPTNLSFGEVTKEQMQELLVLLDSIEFTKENVIKNLKDYAKKKNIKFAIVMKTLRSALSGLNEGPGVADMIIILGKNTVHKRLERTFELQNIGNKALP